MKTKTILVAGGLILASFFIGMCLNSSNFQNPQNLQSSLSWEDSWMWDVREKESNATFWDSSSTRLYHLVHWTEELSHLGNGYQTWLTAFQFDKIEGDRDHVAAILGASLSDPSGSPNIYVNFKYFDFQDILMEHGGWRILFSTDGGISWYLSIFPANGEAFTKAHIEYAISILISQYGGVPIYAEI